MRSSIPRSALTVALLGFMLLVPFVASFGQPPSSTPAGPPCDTVRLDNGMPLIVTPVKDISSAKNKPGDAVQFTIIHTCKVNGVVLIKRGTVVNGRVDKAIHSKMFGKSGSLNVSFQGTQAVDGSPLRVRASLGEKGNQKATTMDKIGSMLPYGVGLAFNGREAILKAGVPLTIFVAEDAFFRTAPGTTPQRLPAPAPSASPRPQPMASPSTEPAPKP